MNSKYSFVIFVFCLVLFSTINSINSAQSAKNKKVQSNKKKVHSSKNKKTQSKNLKISNLEQTTLTKNKTSNTSQFGLLIQQFSNTTLSTETLNYNSATLEKCNNTTCMSLYGNCISNTECLCKDSYAHFIEFSHNETNSSNSACSYERKRLAIAFAMEIIVPFGSSYFYVGKNWLGVIKVCTLLILPMIMLIFSCYCCGSSSPLTAKINNFMLFFLIITYIIGMAFWLIFDLINYSVLRYKDSNGVELEGW